MQIASPREGNSKNGGPALRLILTSMVYQFSRGNIYHDLSLTYVNGRSWQSRLLRLLHLWVEKVQHTGRGLKTGADNPDPCYPARCCILNRHASTFFCGCFHRYEFLS